jgi:hypothetical protein
MHSPGLRCKGAMASKLLPSCEFWHTERCCPGPAAGLKFAAAAAIEFTHKAAYGCHAREMYSYGITTQHPMLTQMAFGLSQTSETIFENPQRTPSPCTFRHHLAAPGCAGCSPLCILPFFCTCACVARHPRTVALDLLRTMAPLLAPRRCLLLTHLPCASPARPSA